MAISERRSPVSLADRGAALSGVGHPDAVATPTVVIGGTSMLGRALRLHAGDAPWAFLSHQEALRDTTWLNTCDRVLNLAYPVALKTAAYDEDLDLDLKIARLIGGLPVHYVMASSRTVYGTGRPGCLEESMQPRPDTHYGKAKLQTETRLAKLLGDRLTVLRLTNIFSPLEASGGRRSFFGLAIRSLKENGHVTLDMSPFVARDFLPAAVLADRMIKILATPATGVFNLGAGHSVPCGRVAQWLIEGYGKGDLIINNMREFDGFAVDVTKASSTWGFPPYLASQLRTDCVALGKIAREDRASVPSAMISRN